MAFLPSLPTLPSVQSLLRYIVGLIIKTSSSPDLMEKEKTYLNKLNLILVSILKRWLPDRGLMGH